MAEKELEFVTEKKSKSAIGKIVKVAAVLTAVNVVVKAYAKHRKTVAEQKEAATQDSPYKVYDVFGDGKNVELEGRITGADMRCLFGGISMDISKADLEKDVYIDMDIWFGGVDIKIPTGVNVSYEGKCLAGGIAKMTSDYEGEDVRTVHITGKIVCGGLAIRVIEEESDLVEDYFEEGSLGKDREKFM